MLTLIICLTVYLLIGLILALLFVRSGADFSIGIIFLWPLVVWLFIGWRQQ